MDSSMPRRMGRQRKSSSPSEIAGTASTGTEYGEEDDEVEEVYDDSSEGEGIKEENTVSTSFCRRRWRRGYSWMHDWNRLFLLACAAGLFVDPLFFYALSISHTHACLFIDGWFALTVTLLRCMTDAFRACNICLRLKKPPYLRDKSGLLFDLFLILPLPQLVLWVAIPRLLASGLTKAVVTVFLIIFLFQYFPKMYHSMRLLRQMQTLTVWWGILLNLLAYFVASHAAGACWYSLGFQRAAQCMKTQSSDWTACQETVYYGTKSLVSDGHGARASLYYASNARYTCLESPDHFNYGAYRWTVQLVSNENRLEKILLPIFWGLMTLSTFGNLESTTEWLEVVFNIVVVTSGLLLVTMLIGNIKVFLNATTSKKQAMQVRMRNLEWWMGKRRLPQEFRQRVRQYERQRWAATRGVDECRMIGDLPEGLRRDIKYHLCLDLVKQVPLFQHMDDLVLENICDRVKSLIFPKAETVTREGDPVRRMIFVVRGHLQSSQLLRDGVESCCMLGPGNFTGDELLSWCLRRPFVERLPPSSATLVTLEATEAFGLEAEDVKYVTQHFRHTFVREEVKRSARYYSPGWRTWAAVAIQLAWRRYTHRLALTSLSFIRPRRPLSRSTSLGEDRLRLYTAMLTSPKPNHHDFDS